MAAKAPSGCAAVAYHLCLHPLLGDLDQLPIVRRAVHRRAELQERRHVAVVAVNGGRPSIGQSFAVDAVKVPLPLPRRHVAVVAVNMGAHGVKQASVE